MFHLYASFIVHFKYSNISVYIVLINIRFSFHLSLLKIMVGNCPYIHNYETLLRGRHFLLSHMLFSRNPVFFCHFTSVSSLCQCKIMRHLSFLFPHLMMAKSFLEKSPGRNSASSCPLREHSSFCARSAPILPKNKKAVKKRTSVLFSQPLFLILLLLLPPKAHLPSYPLQGIINRLRFLPQGLSNFCIGLSHQKTP